MSKKRQGLLEVMGIADSWEVLVFTDGAGSRWGLPVGCSAVLIDRARSTRHLIAAGATDGTVNFAEIFPVILALRHHYYVLGGGKETCIKRVDIFTDSKLVAHQGDGSFRRKKNAELWAAIDAICSFGGYLVEWHWIPRDTWTANKVAHLCADMSREVMIQVAKGLPDPYTMEI